MKNKKICRKIIEEALKTENLTVRKLDKIAKKISKFFKTEQIPTKIQILSYCDKKERKKLKKFLVTKPSRSISGVSVITVVAEAKECPGNCIYCPRGKNAPQSYTGMEPAIQRSIRNKYDPYLQTKDRLNQYKMTGHPTDKIEIIILGGTFLAMNKKYQKWFVKRIFDALNKKESKTLKQAQKLNEKSDHRCVGMTLETRADYCFKKHINQMLDLGITRVEIGVQSVYPEILKKIKRGHTVFDSIKATQLAKDSCLKCTYHLMPALPGVNREKDIEQFEITFNNPDFKPDSLKIYPVLVVKGTELYEMWKNGEYEELNTQDGIDLLTEAMEYIPKYCRVIRIQRDIPTTKVEAGIKKSNLRELVEKGCEKKKVRIKDIRYREVGHKIKKGIYPEKIRLKKIEYDASSGKEIFLSYEDSKNDIIIGFIRLRIPFKPFRKEINEKTGLIRELHVYGPEVPIGSEKSKAWQHKGYGEKLLKKAEEIAKKYGMKKMVIISGFGARKYYYKFGYKPDGPYVSKVLKF